MEDQNQLEWSCNMATIIARAAESVHWYRADDGAPQYTVKAKDGSDRPTTPVSYTHLTLPTNREV